MSGEVVVKVSWGPRPESSLELAERWLVMLRGLTELSGGAAVDWRWDVDGADTGEVVPDTAEDVAVVVEAGGPEEDADIVGRTAAVVGRWPDGGYAYLRAKGGGSDEYTPFTATLQLFPSPAAVTGTAPGAATGAVPGPAPLTDRLSEALTVLAESWDPDTGLTYDRELFSAVKAAFGLRNSHPRCGWATYLSANRAALVPADFSGTRRSTAGGGLVLDTGDTTEAVVAAQRTLSAAGALEPLSASAPRAAW
ncbi:hypothetical protein [Streptomyces griseus]|uniref:hypothetical protein n=1 Tax=Streptomyces griseus TaxID=1911 RepID=UPI0008403E7D|nr:hypothetical protein [Streptomyces griseus]